MIDLDSNDNTVLINPRLSEPEQHKIRTLISGCSHIKGHFWIGTSGSTQQKWVALSKEAVFLSAQVVNTHLHSTREDIWINPLPAFHVGGLGIMVRSALSGATMVELSTGKWDVNAFHQLACSLQATLTALVPTQVYDLVTHELKAPPSLRAVIVGGGALQEPLYQSATALGWPLLPSYGMTESASQVATASLSAAFSENKPAIHLLPHLSVKTTAEGIICIKGDSLLSGYAFYDAEERPVFVDPKRDGWFETEDRGECIDGILHVHGRGADFIKVGGENVNLLRLEGILEKIRLQLGYEGDCALLGAHDERLGHVVHLAATHASEKLVERYNQMVMPFERIRGVQIVPEIPRTAMGKLQRLRL